MSRLKAGLAVVALAVAGFAPSGVAAVSDLTVTSQVLVSSSRVTRTHFDYVYQINLVNAGGPLGNVVAHVVSSSPNTEIIEADVTFGDIAAASTTTSVDTYTLRQDRTFPFDADDLVWSFSASTPANTPPVADAGASREVASTDTVLLSGSASRDADGDDLSFAWSFVSRPIDSVASLDDATSSDPRFVADKVGVYVLQLVVSDGRANSAPATVTVTAAQKMVAVPDLVGLGAVAADQALLKAGLAPGTAGNEASTTIRMFSVIRHTPEAGQMVPLGSAVNYVYSGGGGWVDCPINGVPLAARCTLQHGASQLNIVASFDLDDVLTFELTHNGIVQMRDQGLETFDLRTRAVTDDELLLAQYNAAARSIRLIFRDPTLFVSTAIISLDDLAFGPRLEEALILTAISNFRTRAIFYADFNLGGTLQDGSVVVRNNRTLIQTNGHAAATLELAGIRPQRIQVGAAAELSAQISAENFLPTPDDTIAPSPGELGTFFSWDLMIPANEAVLMGALTQIYVGSEGTATVPDVVGMARADGTGVLESDGLTLGAEQTLAAIGADIGSILAQDPAPGTVVPREFPVSIDVGTMLVPVAVPDVRTLPRGVAERELTIRGLQPGNVTAVASSQTIGRVLLQNPVAGTLVQPGSSVALTTSLGLFVPNVNTLPLDQARATLQAAGYQVGSIAEFPGSGLPVGAVAEQIPTAGSAAAPGTAVNLRIAALAICPCTVPDLFDVPIAQARTLIERAGLTVGNILIEPGSGFGAGAVFYQSVDAGEVLNTATSIDLWVAADEGFVDCPNVGNVYTCSVSAGDTTFTYSLDLAESEVLDYNLTVRGTRHLTRQAYFLFDLDGEESEDVFLVPQYRPATATIRIAEAEDSFRDVTTFDLHATDTGARLDVHTRFVSTDDEPVSGRVYAYTDFDLNDSAVDQSAFLKDGRFMSVDGQTTGIVSVQPAAQAFQIGMLGAISGPLSAGQFLQLDPTATLLRNGNFEQAFSWDVVGLPPGGSFEISANTEVLIGRQVVPPTINSAPVVDGREDTAYLYQVAATSQDYDTIVFELLVAPNGMSIDSATGLISWTPDNSQTGANQCVVIARNSDGLTDEQAFEIAVENVNDPPVIVSEPRRYVRDDDVYSYTLIATDEDLVDALEFNLRTAPAGMSIDHISGEIRWTPTVGQNAVVFVEAQVRDTSGASAIQSWEIEVDAIPETVAVLLEGDQASPARDAIRTYFADGGLSQDDFLQTSDGDRVARNVLEVKILPGATVGEINHALTAVGAGIVAMVDDLAWLTVRFPPAGSIAGLEQLGFALLNSAGVEFVLPKTEITPSEIPAGVSLHRFDNNIAIRMPAAWNLRSSIRSSDVPVVAMIDYFGQGIPNEPQFNVTVLAGNLVHENRGPHTGKPFACLSTDKFERLYEQSHGYKMLSVMAAPFGGPLAGTYQGPPLKVVLIDMISGFDKQTLQCQTVMAPEKVAMVHARHADLLNLSISTPPCTALSESLGWCRADALTDYLRAHLGGDYTIVVSAGNDDGKNTAEKNAYGIAAKNSFQRGFVVENRKAVTTANGPFVNAKVSGLDDSSNIGGDISAVGAGSFGWFSRPNGPEELSSGLGGTSSAAAQVTGLLAFLYALPHPSLHSRAQLNDLVRATTIDLGDQGAPVVDAFAAVLALDEADGSAGWFHGSIRERLLDLNDDGGDGIPEFNVRDVEIFVLERSQPYSRSDLNGGGIGVAEAPFLDFNRFNLDRSSDGRTDITSIGVNEFLTLEYDERLVTDVQVLCYYVQLSPGLIYDGSPTEVDTILRREGFPSCSGRLARAVINLNDAHPEFSGFPGQVTLSYDPVTDGPTTDQFVGPCGPGGENGGPIWSASVVRPAEFYTARASGVPADPALFLSSPGCSTFVALRNFLDTDPATGESLAEMWIGASEGRNRPLGDVREYQIRLYSGEPGQRASTRHGEFGVAGSLTNFSKIFDLVDWNYTLVFRSGEGQ